MRVVLDTNVLVRAHKNASGPAREVLTVVRSETHVLITSPFLLKELVRVLNYPRVRAMHQLSAAEIDEFVEAIYQTSEVVETPVGDPDTAISSDPDDDPIIQTAVIGRADTICTLDHHFHLPGVQAYCAGHEIRVLNDIEILRELREERNLGG